MNTMMTTSAQIAVALGKVCGMVQPAERAKELVAIQSNTGMTIMSNWPFPPATGAVPWTAKQIKEYAQQQRAQLPEAPL
jgi:hypothetical protein